MIVGCRSFDIILYITYKYANSDNQYVYNNLVLIFENSI